MPSAMSLIYIHRWSSMKHMIEDNDCRYCLWKTAVEASVNRRQVSYTAEQRGVQLLKTFIRQASSVELNPVVFCYEHNVNEFQHCGGPNIKCVDLYSDHLGWIDCRASESSNSKEENFVQGGLLKGVMKHGVNNPSDMMLIVSSLSSVILHCGFHFCYRDLQALISGPLLPGVKVSQIVCLVHEDVLLNKSVSLEQLRYLATTCIKLEHTSNSHGKYSSTVIHKKPGGKLLKQREEFLINSNYSISSEEIISHKRVARDPEIVMLPTSTFKLNLEQPEIEARKQLILPYLRSESQSKVQQNESKVFYQPDAADDWDEEDPDEDLDI